MGEDLSSWIAGPDRGTHTNYQHVAAHAAGSVSHDHTLFWRREMILGLEPNAFWLLIGAPAIVIVVMFLHTLRIRTEKDE